MEMSAKVLAGFGGLMTVALVAHPLHAQTKPPGYVVIEFKVKDAESFKTYGQRAPATLAQYGGKFIVRGSKPETLKGDAPEGPFLMIAFESVEQARKWANSPEYTALIPLRDRGADTRAFVIEGALP